jgi:hypothetical protein
MTDNVLVWVGLLLAFCFWGPLAATMFSDSFKQVVTILAPIVGTIGMIVFVVLLVRRYWNNY